MGSRNQPARSLIHDGGPRDDPSAPAWAGADVAEAPPPLTPAKLRRRTLVRSLLAVLVAVTLLPAVASVLLAMDYNSVPTIPVRPSGVLMPRVTGVQPLVNPQGILVTAAGDVFVAEAGLKRLVMFPNGLGQQARDVATAAPPISLGRPWALASGPNDEVYLLDQETGRLHVFTPTGAWLRTLDVAGPGARALAVDQDGSVYVGDNARGLLRKLDPDGRPDPGWGDGPRPGTVSLSAVVGLAVRDGVLYAAGINERTLLRFDRRGRATRGERFRGFPGELALTPDDRLLMSDNQSNRVWVLDLEMRTAGRLVGEDGRETIVFQPRGLAATPGGCILVSMNDRVARFEREGASGC